MSPEAISVMIGITTLIVTLGINLAIVSFRLGQMREDLNHKADLADVVAMKESLSEIKGMFVLKLRELCIK